MKCHCLTLALTFLSAVTLPRPMAAQGNQADSKYAREGVEAAKRKEWDKAIANLRKAMELDPRDKTNSLNLSLALQARGTARVQQKKYDEATTDLSESLKLNEDNVGAHRFRAFALLSKRDYENALKDYDAVLAQKDGDMERLTAADMC